MALPAALTGKRVMIDKANATMLAIIGVTSFVVIFALVTSRALLSQGSYQGRVISAKEKALKQLTDNNKNVVSLVESYKSFAEEPVNVIDGNPKGGEARDGDNPKIVLDALPSKYDFPGLTSSIEKLLSQGGYQIESIGGTDDELAQQDASSDSPEPVEIPFPLAINTDYSGAQRFLSTLEHSIRPMYISQLSIAANGSQLNITAAAKTYYPATENLKNRFEGYKIMKKNDIAVIIFIVFFSGIVSFFISNALFSSPKNRQQKVEEVEKISAEFTRPDTKFFNKESINPTQVIQIGTDSNSKPFSGQ